MQKNGPAGAGAWGPDGAPADRGVSHAYAERRGEGQA